MPDPAGDGVLRIAVQIVLPAADRLAARPAVLFCLPGGGMSKRYFDLGGDGDRRFSFAQAMAEHGCITVAIDPPGIGESMRIDDGYRIDPELLATAYEAAVRSTTDALRGGLAGRAPIAELVSIGIGHSMGAMTVVTAQARTGLHEAMIVMGSGPYGLPEHLPPNLGDLAGDPVRARTNIAARMRESGIPPIMDLPPSEASRAMIGRGDPAAREALRAARAPLLTVPGFFVMIPGSWAPEAASITTPLMLVFGDADICKDPRAVPAWFPAANDISLVVLPETGHNHFVHASIGALTRRIAGWIQSLFDGAGDRPGVQ